MTKEEVLQGLKEWHNGTATKLADYGANHVTIDGIMNLKTTVKNAIDYIESMDTRSNVDILERMYMQEENYRINPTDYAQPCWELAKDIIRG